MTEFSAETLRNTYWFHEAFIGFGNPTIRIRGWVTDRLDEKALAVARIYEGVSNDFDNCKKGIFRDFDSLLVEQINKHLVPIDQLVSEYEKVLNGDSQTKRVFLQELFLAVPTDDVNLSSLLYYMLVQPATQENGYYILSILPRVHNSLSFFLCLRVTHLTDESWYPEMGAKEHLDQKLSATLQAVKRHRNSSLELVYHFKNPNFYSECLELLDPAIGQLQKYSSQIGVWSPRFIEYLIEYLMYCDIQNEYSLDFVPDRVMRVLTSTYYSYDRYFARHLANMSDEKTFKYCIDKALNTAKSALNELSAISTESDLPEYLRVFAHEDRFSQSYVPLRVVDSQVIPIPDYILRTERVDEGEATFENMCLIDRNSEEKVLFSYCAGIERHSLHLNVEEDAPSDEEIEGVISSLCSFEIADYQDESGFQEWLYDSSIEIILTLLPSIGLIEGCFDVVEGIFKSVEVESTLFTGKVSKRITMYIEEGRGKQSRLKAGKYHGYKNPSHRYIHFYNDVDLFENLTLKSVVREIQGRRISDWKQKHPDSDWESEYDGGFQDDIREELGFRRSGEEWVSETELFYLIKRMLEKRDTIVIHHHRPKFLNGQEYDIYFELNSIKVAVEYQGKQHYEPIAHFGGEDGYRKTVERDRRKKRLSKQEGIKLVYISYKEEVSSELVAKKLRACGVDI